MRHLIKLSKSMGKIENTLKDQKGFKKLCLVGSKWLQQKGKLKVVKHGKTFLAYLFFP